MSVIRSLIIIWGFQATFAHSMAVFESCKKYGFSKNRFIAVCTVLYIVYDIYKDHYRRLNFLKFEQQQEREKEARIRGVRVQQKQSIQNNLAMLKEQRDAMLIQRLNSHNDENYDPQWWINQARKIRDLENMEKQCSSVCTMQ